MSVRGDPPVEQRQRDLPAQLQDLMVEVSTELSPARALCKLLDRCVQATGASGGILYKLALAHFAYECVCRSGEAPEAIRVDTDILNRRGSPGSPVESAILSRKAVRVTDSSGGVVRLLSPIVRGDECLGLFDFPLPRSEPVAEDVEHFLKAAAAAALLLFEKQQTFDLLVAVQQPVDFHQSFRKFLSDLLALVSEAAGMPYVVLRELVEPDTLECIAHYGFPSELDRHQLDLHPLAEHPSFKTALEKGAPVTEPRKDADHLKNLRKLTAASDVRSFVVVPVRVGEQNFGTASFGCSCQYNYTLLEQTGFETIANGLGVAISNYRNFHKRQDAIIESIQVSTTITAVEVAQAARHEARHYLDVAQNRLALMNTALGQVSRSVAKQLTEDTSRLSDTLRSISISLDRIKSITKPPQRERLECSLNEVWQDAFDVVEGRLAHEHIEYRISGQRIVAHVFPDFLLHAFLNLILNSVDAFREFGKRRNRLITVSLDTQSEAANTIKMKYTDNATGIEPSMLRPKAHDRDLSVDDIFTAGVTSKKDGSGYGLYLVRNILQEHGGSIDLKSHRGGVQFELTLPKGSQS